MVAGRSMTSTKAVYAETINVLEKHGWARGTTHGPNGEVCLLIALGMAGGSVGRNVAWRDLLRGLREAIAPGRPFDLGRWNDRPERTYAQVIGVLAGLADVRVDEVPATLLERQAA